MRCYSIENRYVLNVITFHLFMIQALGILSISLLSIQRLADFSSVFAIGLLQVRILNS